MKEKYPAVSLLYTGNHPKTMQDINAFIRNVPKAELHIHIEGSIEPELMFSIAERNKVPLPFKSTDEVRKAYKFSSLKSFLDVYYQGIGVLDKEKDFYDITWAYLKTAHSQKVCHAEFFFDPQIHTDRGIPFETVMNGIRCAMLDAQRKMGISSKLILCFLRHLGVESAMETLRRAIPWKEWIAGVGLDSYEAGNPPEKFIPVFDKAREEGFLAVAHAGEEGPAEYIWQALEKLKVSRIDHGVRCVEDARLLEKLKVEQIPLTVCPLSNVKLHVFSAMEKHNLKQLLDLGLCVTVNSDDPAYFGGYITENFLAVHEALNLSHHDVYRLAKNSFQASFLTNEEKRRMLDKLDKFTFADNPPPLRCR